MRPRPPRPRLRRVHPSSRGGEWLLVKNGSQFFKTLETPATVSTTRYSSFGPASKGIRLSAMNQCFRPNLKQHFDLGSVFHSRCDAAAKRGVLENVTLFVPVGR